MALPRNVGQVLLYRLTAADVDYIKNRRFPPVGFAQRILGVTSSPSPYFQGSQVNVGDIVSLTVTAIRPLDASVNGQAVLDGNDNVWVVNAREGSGPGNWSTPV